MPEGAVTGKPRVKDADRNKATSPKELEISGTGAESPTDLPSDPTDPIEDDPNDPTEPGADPGTGDAPGDTSPDGISVDPDKGFFEGKRLALAHVEGDGSPTDGRLADGGDVVATVPVKDGTGEATAKWNGVTSDGEVAPNGEYEYLAGGAGDSAAFEQYDHIFPINGKHEYGDGMGPLAVTRAKQYGHGRRLLLGSSPCAPSFSWCCYEQLLDHTRAAGHPREAWGSTCGRSEASITSACASGPWREGHVCSRGSRIAARPKPRTPGSRGSRSRAAVRVGPVRGRAGRSAARAALPRGARVRRRRPAPRARRSAAGDGPAHPGVLGVARGRVDEARALLDRSLGVARSLDTPFHRVRRPPCRRWSRTTRVTPTPRTDTWPSPGSSSPFPPRAVRSGRPSILIDWDRAAEARTLVETAVADCARRRWAGRDTAHGNTLLGLTWLPSEPARAASCLERARTWAREANEVEMVLRCHHLALQLARVEGRAEDAVQAAGRGAALASEQGFLRFLHLFRPA